MFLILADQSINLFCQEDRDDKDFSMAGLQTSTASLPEGPLNRPAN
jgi:hypothetical protein